MQITNKQFIICTIIIILTIIILYSYSIDNFFSRDDFFFINHNIKTKLNPLEFLDTYSWFTTDISFFFTLNIFGTNPFWFNLTNLSIHIINVILLALMLLQISGNRLIALLTMLFFGINSQGAETILWTSTRSHLLILTFLITTLIFFIAWRKTNKFIFYISSLFFSMLAQLSGFEAIITPIILAAYLYIFEPYNLFKNKIIYFTKILSPFIILSAIKAFIFLFIKTTLPISTYYKLDYTILLKFGKYFFDYFDFLYLHYLLWNYKNLSLIIIISIVFTIIYFALLLKLKDKIIKFGLLWIPVTMLSYLPVPIAQYIQTSRYRYIPIAGFCIFLSSIIYNFFSSTYSKKAIIKTATVFSIVLFVFVNIYYIHLQQQDYNFIGKIHLSLVNGLKPIANSIPKDKTIIFINNFYFNGPKYITDHLKLPFPLFGNAYAVLGMVNIESLLNFCCFDKQTKGIYEIEDSKQKIIEDIKSNNITGLMFTKDGFSFFKFNQKQLNILVDKLNALPSFPPEMTALRWTTTFK